MTMVNMNIRSSVQAAPSKAAYPARYNDKNITLFQRLQSLCQWRYDWRVALLGVLVLLSAFSVVYIKDLNRRLLMRYQTYQTQNVSEYIEWGKLLLEQGTLSRQSRIQRIATEKLGMHIPRAKNIVMVSAGTAYSNKGGLRTAI